MEDPTAIFPYPDLDLVWVRGGSFLMGDEHDGSVHEVCLSSFYIGRYPVTQRLWQAVMGSNPSRFAGKMRPVETVSWYDAVEFISRLNGNAEIQEDLHKQALVGSAFCLPTEAQWEYAARGGDMGKVFRYAGSDHIKDVGWCRNNSYGESKPVGLKLANGLGLHDLNGNVWEWCQNRGIFADPPGYELGDYRMLRGGSWLSAPESCSVTSRLNRGAISRHGDIGFRLVCSYQSG